MTFCTPRIASMCLDLLDNRSLEKSKLASIDIIIYHISINIISLLSFIIADGDSQISCLFIKGKRRLHNPAARCSALIGLIRYPFPVVRASLSKRLLPIGLFLLKHRRDPSCWWTWQDKGLHICPLLRTSWELCAWRESAGEDKNRFDWRNGKRNIFWRNKYLSL